MCVYLRCDEAEQHQGVGRLSEIEEIGRHQQLGDIDGAHRQPFRLLHSESHWKRLQPQCSEVIEECTYVIALYISGTINSTCHPLLT